MSYIDDSLVEGETVLHRARVSWWSQSGLIVLGLVLLVVVVGLFFIIAAWINVRSTEIAITNRRIIAKFGFIRRNTVEINLEPGALNSRFAEHRRGPASAIVPRFVEELLAAESGSVPL